MGKIVNNKWASIYLATIVSALLLFTALPGASQVTSDQPTASAQVVVPAFVDIVLRGGTIDFGTVFPGTTDSEQGQTSPTRLEINITETTNVGLNLTANLTDSDGDNLTYEEAGGQGFEAHRHEYTNLRNGYDNTTKVGMQDTALPTGPCVALCGGNFSNWTNMNFPASNFNANQSRFMQNFIDIPTGQLAATYTATVTISAHRNNTS